MQVAQTSASSRALDPLEQIKRVDSNSKEYWIASEIQYILGCENPKKFQKALYSVFIELQEKDENINSHIMQIKRRVKKDDSIFVVDDFTLSRYALNLLISSYSNDSKKKPNNVVKFKRHSKFKVFYIAIFTCLILLFFLGLSIMYIDIKPFTYVRNLYVSTAMTTRRFQWAAKIFYSPEDLQTILDEIIPPETGGKTDVTILDNKIRENDIKIYDIKDKSFTGKMMVVGDPAKVKVTITKNFLKTGQLLADLVEDAGAIGGINGSGFVDYNGTSLGGEPVGIVIKDGELCYLPAEDDIKIVGFDYDDNLIVGRFNKHELKDLNLRDAVEPFYLLTINGEDRIQSGDGGYGLQPRSAIGQTSDGRVLMLTIDGRKLDSLGATMKDVQDIMDQYGAVNCAALDGGSSTVMYYKGAVINRPSTADGGNTGRYLPSAFIVYE